VSSADQDSRALAAKLAEAKKRAVELEREMTAERARHSEVERELLGMAGEIELLRKHAEDFVEHAETIERKNEQIERALTAMRARMSNARVSLDIDREALARVRRKLASSRGSP
jgi:chromosome segregation ATPase